MAPSLGAQKIVLATRCSLLPNSFPLFPPGFIGRFPFRHNPRKIATKFSKIVPARKTHVLSSRRIFFPSGALACLLHQYLYQESQNRSSRASPCSSAPCERLHLA